MRYPLDDRSNSDILRDTALRVLGLIIQAPRGRSPSIQDLTLAVGVTENAIAGALRRLHVAGLISRGDFNSRRTVRPTCRFVPVEQLFPED